ncbi:MAG TPA: hypothetical protein DCW29_15385 [Janthinobacterium sp.]|nr:hypothetical protein [Janthinobacterium sp.]
MLRFASASAGAADVVAVACAAIDGKLARAANFGGMPSTRLMSTTGVPVAATLAYSATLTLRPRL